MQYKNKFYYRAKLTLGPAIKTWYRMQIKGEENIPKDGVVIFASNHLSHIDSVCIGVAIPRELYFLAKKGVAKHRFAGPFAQRLNTLYVERETPSKDSLVKILKHLKKNKPLLMFPAGTRAKDGSIGIIKPGVAWLSVKAKEKYNIDVPIVPIAIKGTYKIHHTGWIPFWRKVRINIGEKIETANKDYKELTDILRKEISRLFYS